MHDWINLKHTFPLGPAVSPLGKGKSLREDRRQDLVLGAAVLSASRLAFDL